MKSKIILSVGGAAVLAVSAIQAQTPAVDPLATLLKALEKIENPESQAGILRGANLSLKGRRDISVPANWAALYEKLKASPNEEVRKQAQALAVTFGGDAALQETRRRLADPKAEVAARQEALEALVAVKDAASSKPILELIKAPGPLRSPALRGLANFEDAEIPTVILEVYPNLDTTEKRDALNTMTARPANAKALIQAVDGKKIPRNDITAPLARQLQNMRDWSIVEWTKKNWGSMKATSEQKQKEIARYKEFLGTEAILHADVKHGRQIFSQTCAVCHTLYGEGGKIGPELPGSFADVDYLLQNIIDPNATIGKDYQQTFVTLKSGQFVGGIIVSEDNKTVVLKSLAEPVTVLRSEIKEMQTSDLSMMPEGLLTAYDEQTVRDLFLYLRQSQQVPLPAATK